MSAVLTLQLAAALLAGDSPAAQRIKKLSPDFSPHPGSAVRVNWREVRDLVREGKLPQDRLRGFIVVTPPKGTCFTVTRAPDIEDDTVCRKTALPFTLDQLDKAGRLHWQVSTGPGDFGTELVWPTPYRRALLLPFSDDPIAQPVYKYVDGCEADRTPGQRQIRVTFLTGETMTMHFEDQDQAAKQPDAMPNLYVAVDGAKVPEESLRDDGQQDKKEEKKDDKKEEKTGEKKEAKGEGEGKAEAPPPPKKKAEPAAPKDERSDWAIPRRGSYVISSDHLRVHAWQTPGLHGVCRYHYEGPADDPRTGRLECHDADGYKIVYLPLPCLADVRPKG